MRIVLACNAGMSTSILKMKLEQEMTKDGKEANVIAVPVSEINDHLENASVVLLGPQIRFLKNEIQEKTDVPVLAIDIKDYGSMNAAKVYATVKEVLGE